MKFTRLLPIVAALGWMLLIPACSGRDGEHDNQECKATLSTDEVNCLQTGTSGSQYILLRTEGDKNAQFHAVITEGGDFCKFANGSAEYTENVGKSVYFYLDGNYAEKERMVTVRVEFNDNSPSATLRFRQLGYSASASYDKHQWAELPAHVDNSDYIYKTYYTTLTSNNGATVRNYSICYDAKRHVSHWVAYPLHMCYTSPSVSRGNNWAYDPNEFEPFISQSIQQYIIETYGSGHQRGHLLPSASRYNTAKTNDQTFYATNMMPQNGNFNGGVWAELESAVRANQGTKARDTLYVVTGTYFGNNNTITDKRNTVISVPSHAYKVLLKARKAIPEGQTIADLGADDLKAIGFWFENSNGGANTTISKAACTVEEIEAKTGFSYFQMLKPEVAKAVKQQKKLNDWGI